MSGCYTCGGFGNRHDPVAHGAEPEPDDDYLFDLAYEQQTAAAKAKQAGTDDRCPSCRHRWHGMACHIAGAAMCPCPSSVAPLPHAKEAS